MTKKRTLLALLTLLALWCLGWGLLKWLRDPVRLRSGEFRGVDVSAHQGSIDWSRVAASGIQFAYIKATEGGDWVDDHFRSNWQGAASAGVRRGAYHFYTLRRPGADQAANFLKVAAPEAGTLAPVVDLEFGGNSNVRPPREYIVRELTTFIQQVEAAYQRPVILYLLPEFENTYQVYRLFPRRIWLRSLMTRPPTGLDWQIWQYTPLGRVPGIEGDVDLNISR